MNISRLLSFLPLLMLLPAASGATLLPAAPMHHANVVAHVAHIVPSDLCPLVQIVEHELCDTAHSLHNASKLSDLCVLLQNYNASFCSKHEAPSHSSNDVLSILTLKNEFLNHDIHDVCPILNFIDQELCTSRLKEEFQFYPKQLCPLLNFTYDELCS